MSNNKNNRVSPANIIAIISVAALGVITFFGALFLQEDGTLGFPAIIAGAFTVGLGMLLVICIMAKKTEKEFDKWRVFEYISLVAYLVVAVTCYKPFLQFFHVVQHKEKLQKMAMDEIDSIDSLCAQYNIEAESCLGQAAKYMEEYEKSEQDNFVEDGGLSSYMSKHRITKPETWYNDNIDIVGFTQESLDSLRQRIETWNFMDLSAIAYEMKDKGADTWKQLDKHINDFEEEYDLIPVIRIDTTGGEKRFYLNGKAELPIGECPASSKFTTEFRKPWSGFNIGVIIYILLHFLALANYFLVRRSPIVQIRKDKRNDDGGLVLDVGDQKD